MIRANNLALKLILTLIYTTKHIYLFSLYSIIKSKWKSQKKN